MDHLTTRQYNFRLLKFMPITLKLFSTMNKASGSGKQRMWSGL